MYAKIISLGLVGAVLAIDAGRHWLQHVPVDARRGPQLVPQAVGAWPQTARWIYPSGMGQFQEYAQYARDGLLITLSFDRNRLSAHNALDCFLGKGGELQAVTVRSLKTLDGSARFNLAHFRDGGSISVVAASQCLAQGCIENPPAPTWSDVGKLSFWREELFTPRYTGIPVNVTVASDAGQPQQASYELMEQALAGFVENLDMAPVQRLVPAEPAS